MVSSHSVVFITKCGRECPLYLTQGGCHVFKCSVGRYALYPIEVCRKRRPFLLIVLFCGRLQGILLPPKRLKLLCDVTTCKWFVNLQRYQFFRLCVGVNKYVHFRGRSSHQFFPLKHFPPLLDSGKPLIPSCGKIQTCSPQAEGSIMSVDSASYLENILCCMKNPVLLHRLPTGLMEKTHRFGLKLLCCTLNFA